MTEFFMLSFINTSTVCIISQFGVATAHSNDARSALG